MQERRFRAVEESEPQVRLESRTKGARLSLARVGSYYWQKVSKQLKLTASFMREHLPPPRLEHFRVRILYRRRDHHHRGIHGQVFFLMADKNLRAKITQPPRRFAVVQVGTTHRVP